MARTLGPMHDSAVHDSAVHDNVERFPTAQPSARVTDELNRILAILRKAAPDKSQISFDFDGCLHVHIDVRTREDVVFLERMLPGLEPGLFHSVSVGSTPHHPFFHRVSGLVNA